MVWAIPPIPNEGRKKASRMVLETRIDQYAFMTDSNKGEYMEVWHLFFPFSHFNYFCNILKKGHFNIHISEVCLWNVIMRCIPFTLYVHFYFLPYIAHIVCLKVGYE